MIVSVALLLWIFQTRLSNAFVPCTSKRERNSALNALQRKKPENVVVRRNSDKIVTKPLLQPPKLLTFAAEGTLFQWSTPIGLQLRECLLRHNGYTLRLPGPAAFEEEYNQAYKNRNEEHPCFGLHTNVPSDIWWRDVYYNSICRTVEKYMIPYTEVVDPVFKNVFDELYYETFTGLEAWELRTDVLQTLDRLADWRDAGGPFLGVIANSDERLSTILDNLDILDHFDFVFASREVGTELPDTAMLDLALKKSGLTNALDAIHCGNRVEVDIEAAARAGWRSCIVKKPPFPRGSQSFNVMYLSGLLPLFGLPSIPGPIKTTRRRGPFAEEDE